MFDDKAQVPFNPVQNFKLLDRADPFLAILKEGEEMFIKDVNGNIKKVKEIKMEEGVKIPQAIIDQINMLEKLKVEHNSNPDTKCQADLQETSKNLISQLENFHKQVQMKSQENRLEDGIFINKNEDKLANTDEVDYLSAVISSSWVDSDIEKLILDSINDKSQDTTSKLPICNLMKTESGLKHDWINSNNKVKYVVVYIIITLPLFAVYYLQNKKYKSLADDWNLYNSSFSPSSKDQKPTKTANKKGRNLKCGWNLPLYLLNKVFGIPIFDQMWGDGRNYSLDSSLYSPCTDRYAISPTYSIISKFSEFKQFKHDEYYYEYEGSETKQFNSFDFIITNSHRSKEISFSDEFDMPCKFCNDSYDYSCPKHHSLYSTDEASSIETEVNCSSAPKASKQSKSKKKVKEEVKNPKPSLLSSIAKLFTQ